MRRGGATCQSRRGLLLRLKQSQKGHATPAEAASGGLATGGSNGAGTAETVDVAVVRGGE